MNIINRLRSARARIHDERLGNLGSEIDLMEEAADLIERIQDEEAEACAEIADDLIEPQVAAAIRGRIADRKAAQNP